MSGSVETQRLLGEVAGLVRELKEQAKEDRAENKANEERRRVWEERLFQDFNAAKHEWRNGHQAVHGRMELMTIEQARLKERIDTLDQSFVELRESVRVPLEDFVSFRDRMRSVGWLGMALLFIAWGVIGPMITGVVQKLGFLWMGLK